MYFYTMENFVMIKPEDWQKSPFQAIGKDWMLITAGNKEKVNTMTASWGGFGILWRKHVAYIVIRPQRYTKTFVEQEKQFSLSFLDENYRKELNYLGTVSGRNEAKIKNAGLTVAFEDNIPYLTESNTVILCKTLYQQDVAQDCFLEKAVDQLIYPEKDYHTLYIAEITGIYTKK